MKPHFTTIIQGTLMLKRRTLIISGYKSYSALKHRFCQSLLFEISEVDNIF